jgi:hypothetical protein
LIYSHRCLIRVKFYNNQPLEWSGPPAKASAGKGPPKQPYFPLKARRTPKYHPPNSWKQSKECHPKVNIPHSKQKSGKMHLLSLSQNNAMSKMTMEWIPSMLDIRLKTPKRSTMKRQPRTLTMASSRQLETQ